MADQFEVSHPDPLVGSFRRAAVRHKRGRKSYQNPVRGAKMNIFTADLENRHKSRRGKTDSHVPRVNESPNTSTIARKSAYQPSGFSNRRRFVSFRTLRNHFNTYGAK